MAHDQSVRWTAAAILVLSAGLAADISHGAEAGPSACRLSQFDVMFSGLVSEATGQRTITLRLVNRRQDACVLTGYPMIQAYDRVGLLPFAIKHGGDQMVTSRRPRPLVVRARGTAYVAMNHYRCDLGDLRTATTLRIGNGRVRRSGMGAIRMTDQYQRLAYCGSGDPGSTLAVSPFEPALHETLKY